MISPIRPLDAYTPDAVERYDLLAGDRPFMTICPLCLYRALSITTTKKEGFRLECRACASNGFTPTADRVWGMLGCGEALAAMPFEKRAARRSVLSKRGAELLGPKSWNQAVFGPEGGATRSVFNYGVVCFGCGGLDASLRLDVNGKAYTVCARGCRTRLFFPREEAVARHLGWTTARAKVGDKLWNGWFRAGRSRWMAWHGSGVGATGASTAAEGHEQVRDGFSGQQQR